MALKQSSGSTGGAAAAAGTAAAAAAAAKPGGRTAARAAARANAAASQLSDGSDDDGSDFDLEVRPAAGLVRRLGIGVVSWGQGTTSSGHAKQDGLCKLFGCRGCVLTK